MIKKYTPTAIFVIFAFLFILICNSIYDNTANNGDYGRSIGLFTHDFGKHDPMPHSMKLSYDNMFIAIIPSSTVRVFLSPYVIFSIMSGSREISFDTLFFIFSFTYFLGLILIFSKNMIAIHKRFFIFIIFVFIYFIFGYLFKSVFEEAACLALIPLFVYASSVKRQSLFVTISIAIIYTKAQMLYLIPFFGYIFYRSKYFSSRNTAVFLFFMLLASSAQIVKAYMYHATAANQYNRLYNGFGWALQNVQNWPVKHFINRYDYYENNKYDLFIHMTHKDLFPTPQLAGTSYWMAGIENSTIDQGQKNLLGSFLSLITNPQTLALWSSAAFKVGYGSDFNNDYIKRYSNIHINLANFQKITHIISTYIGYISIAVVIITLLMFSNYSLELAFISTFFMLTAPLFVVSGDGFYEFEKHFAPMLWFFFAVPAALGLARDGEKLRGITQDTLLNRQLQQIADHEPGIGDEKRIAPLAPRSCQEFAKELTTTVLPRVHAEREPQSRI